MKKKIKHSRQGSNGIVHGSYFGEVNNNNIPHGKGKCTFEDGFVYEGYWKNGKREGKGKFTYPNNKDYAEGMWKNDLMNGLGVMDIDGEYYEGEFKNHMRHGKGTYLWKHNKNTHEGMFKNNLRNGFGRYFNNEEGSVNEGMWKNDQMHGQGKIILGDGSSISGIFNHTSIEGIATMRFPNGEIKKAKYEDLLKQFNKNRENE